MSAPGLTAILGETRTDVTFYSSLRKADVDSLPRPQLLTTAAAQQLWAEEGIGSLAVNTSLPWNLS